jgi:hypothetical protein
LIDQIRPTHPSAVPTIPPAVKALSPGGAKNAIVQIAGKKLQFAIPGSG